MLSGRLRECLKILRWEAADLADQLGYRDYEVRPWLDGRAVPPLAVAAWLEAWSRRTGRCRRPAESNRIRRSQ